MEKANITIKQVDKIIDLSKKGVSLRDIGVLVGLSYEAVRQIIKKYQKK
jgi:lambda repressor-like predicted transcriptional regulator